MNFSTASGYSDRFNDETDYEEWRLRLDLLVRRDQEKLRGTPHQLHHEESRSDIYTRTRRRESATAEADN